MPISDFDSNGLIFALDFESSKKMFGPFEKEVYDEAIRNIMDAQGFSFFPLVNNPRVRKNVNDMTRRPTYTKGDDVSKVTRIAFVRCNELHTMVRGEIFEANEKSDVLSFIRELADCCKEDPNHPFVGLVVNDEGPVALFTPRELISNRLKHAIVQEFLGNKLGKNEFNQNRGHHVNDLLTAFQTIHDLHGEIDRIEGSEVDSSGTSGMDELSSAYMKVSKLLGDVLSNPKDLSSRRYRERSTRTVPSEVPVSDVMRFGAAGVFFDDSEASRLAVKLLCIANDFDHLVAYTAEGLEQTFVLNQESTKIDVEFVNHDDSLSSTLDILFLQDKPVFVKPSELQTGEGPMHWPSLLTYDDINNINGAVWALSKIVQIEQHIKEQLPFKSEEPIYVKGKYKPLHRLSISDLSDRLTRRNWCRDNRLTRFVPGDFPDESFIQWRNQFVHEQVSKGDVTFSYKHKGVKKTIEHGDLIEFGNRINFWMNTKADDFVLPTREEKSDVPSSSLGASTQKSSSTTKTTGNSTTPKKTQKGTQQKNQSTKKTTNKTSTKKTTNKNSTKKTTNKNSTKKKTNRPPPKINSKKKLPKDYTKEEINRQYRSRLPTTIFFRGLDFSDVMDCVWALRNFETIFRTREKIARSLVHESLRTGWYAGINVAVEKHLIKARLESRVNDGMSFADFIQPLG
jgi:hypothetical protein